MVVALVIAVFPPAGLDGQAAKAAALAVAAIGFWATAALPGHVTALAFFLIAMLVGVAPAEVVFSGFASTAIWLIFGGMLFGAAVQRTGLGARIARAMGVLFPQSYFGVLAGVVAVALLLAFLVPSSMGRIVLVLPIAIALADGLGFERGSNGRIGIVLAAGIGAFLPAFAVLTGNVPNVVLLGAAETVWGVSLLYGQYLLLHFPVLGLLKALALPPVIFLLFPDRARPRQREDAAAGPMTAEEKRLALFLVLALGLWATDFLHHISPAWVGLGAGLLCLLPRIGVMPSENFARDIDLAPVIYVAGVIGLGAVAAHTGLGAALARGLLGLGGLDVGADLQNFAVAAGASALLSLAVTLPPVPIIMTPLAEGIVAATGLSIEAALMLQVVGFSTVLLPFQSPPLIVGLHMGGVPVERATRVILVMAALTILVLLPLDYLWWQALGWFG